MPTRGERLRISLPVDQDAADTTASGWYETIVVGVAGFQFETLSRLVSRLTVLDSQLRATHMVPPKLVGVCAPDAIVVRPFPIGEMSPALSFPLASVEWIRV